jgi:hypothetical protein
MRKDYKKVGRNVVRSIDGYDLRACAGNVTQAQQDAVAAHNRAQVAILTEKLAFTFTVRLHSVLSHPILIIQCLGPKRPYRKGYHVPAPQHPGDHQASCLLQHPLRRDAVSPSLRQHPTGPAHSGRGYTAPPQADNVVGGYHARSRSGALECTLQIISIDASI